MLIPSLLLQQLYTRGSLKNVDGGVQFSVKNRLKDASLSEILEVKIDGNEIPLTDILIDAGNGAPISAAELADGPPVDFPLKKSFAVISKIPHLSDGKHKIGISFKAEPFGKLKFKTDGAIKESQDHLVKIPRNAEDDYGPEAIKTRQDFVKEITGVDLKHAAHYSIDPHILEGNCEHFTGVIQVPMGIAGPIQINGEHAKGEFLIPMATTEGTLVASYNRGIKLLNLSGGVRCTVVEDAMQRAPVFVFDNATDARDFVRWIKANFDTIKEQAEVTTSVGKLLYIDDYLASKFAYLRFNYSTGDAAGQNMVGRATFAACSWILDNYKEREVKHFYLESNLATDKKASQVNVMHTRGKRVTAEVIVPRDVLIQNMRVEPESLAYHASVANVGAILSGANNNGAHSANGITAMFIATGQDVANVSESSAAIAHAELTKEGDIYFSITIPSLIVATHGGGSNLPHAQECLGMMGCVGRGTVNKFAEIVAGVVLAGELSLASAISSSDWVSSHEQYGRNR